VTGSLIIVAAYILDRIIGDPRWIPHPVVGMGKLITLMESIVRRFARSARALRWAGLLLPLTVVGTAYVLTWLAVFLFGQIHAWLAIAAQVLLIATTIASKGLKDAGMAVYRELRAGDLPAARTALGMIVGRNTKELDEPEIVRGTVETIAENIVDAIISPLFYALIGGAPLAMAYRAVNTLDSMVGYKNEKYIHLGWASARLDDAANYIPARLAAALLVSAAWLKRLEPLRSWRTVRRDAGLHPSPNSGFPESAVAGALGVRLGGYNVYHGVRSFRAYMGDPLRPLEAEDIRGTTALMFLSSWLFVLLCVVAGGIGWFVMLPQ
jgi:adenosylcobinamide-phosphate synthase